MWAPVIWSVGTSDLVANQLGPHNGHGLVADVLAQWNDNLCQMVARTQGYSEGPVWDVMP